MPKYLHFLRLARIGIQNKLCSQPKWRKFCDFWGYKEPSCIFKSSPKTPHYKWIANVINYAVKFFGMCRTWKRLYKAHYKQRKNSLGIFGCYVECLPVTRTWCPFRGRQTRQAEFNFSLSHWYDSLTHKGGLKMWVLNAGQSSRVFIAFWII